MKKFTLLLVLAFTLMHLQGCREILPDVTFGPPANIGDRMVLIEEFTGAQCTFCPPGSEELANLLALYPNNLAVVGIHTGFFATPFPGKSKYDFRNADADGLNNFLGAPDKGYPSAIINRRPFPGQNSLHNPLSQWAGLFNEEVNKEAAIGLKIESDYQSADRSLSVKVTGLARTAINHPLRVTVMLTESYIVDYQKDIRYGDVLDYVHKHVLRDVLNSNVEGDPFATGMTTGQEAVFNISGTLNEQWIPENCELIVFVSDPATKYVLQVAKKKLN